MKFTTRSPMNIEKTDIRSRNYVAKPISLLFDFSLFLETVNA